MPRPFKLKPFVPKEWEHEQKAIFDWWWIYQEKIPGLDMLYATLNGLRLTPGQARKASERGMRRGQLDIGLDVARSGHHGLRIELKRTVGGRLSDAQKWWIRRLTEEGYRAETVRGASDAIDRIAEYLGYTREGQPVQ
jgi:hypothetical protein